MVKSKLLEWMNGITATFIGIYILTVPWTLFTQLRMLVVDHSIHDRDVLWIMSFFSDCFDSNSYLGVEWESYICRSVYVAPTNYIWVNESLTFLLDIHIAFVGFAILLFLLFLRDSAQKLYDKSNMTDSNAPRSSEATFPKVGMSRHDRELASLKSRAQAVLDNPNAGAKQKTSAKRVVSMAQKLGKVRRIRRPK